MRLIELLRRLAGFCGNDFGDLDLNVEGGKLAGELRDALPFAADSWRNAIDCVECLAMEAKAGDDRALLGLQEVAGYALQSLLEVVGSRDGAVNAFNLPVGVKPRPVPLLLKPNTFKNWQAEAVRQAALQGVTLIVRKEENKNRSRRRPGDELALKWAKELNEMRGPADVSAKGSEVENVAGMPRKEVIELILKKGWEVRTGDVVKVWRGWRDAAWFLPRPCKQTAKLWWKVCLAKLGDEVGAKWQHDVDLLQAFAPTKTSGDDAVRLAVMRRFERAVETLPVRLDA